MGKMNKTKIEANRAILAEMRKRGLRYENMKQSVVVLARLLDVNIYNLPDLAARIAILAKLTGRSFKELVLADKNVNRKLKAAGVSASWKKDPAPRAAKEQAIKKFYQSWEWKRLSYDVKLERGRKCECCGAKAPNVTIHTDHIKPIRHHWHLRLEKENLQVLCEDCNMGKGSRDETDFRGLNEDRREASELTEQEQRMMAIHDQLRIH